MITANVVVVNEQDRAAAADVISPYQLGMFDAADSWRCLPEYYFVRQWQIDGYLAGYENAMAKMAREVDEAQGEQTEWMR